MLFDNSKIRQLVPQFQPTIPFRQGAKEIIAWYDEDPSRQVIDQHNDHIQDRLIESMCRAAEEVSKEVD